MGVHDRLPRGIRLEAQYLERLRSRHGRLRGSGLPRTCGGIFVRSAASPVCAEPPVQVGFQKTCRLQVVSLALREKGEELPGSERVEGPAPECPAPHLAVQLSGVVVDRHSQPIGLDPGCGTRRGSSRSLRPFQCPP